MMPSDAREEEKAEARLRGALEPGERLLWSARAGRPRLSLAAAGIAALLLVAVAIVAEWLMAMRGAADLARVATGLFTARASLMLVATAWNAPSRGHLLYGVSGRRVFIVMRGWGWDIWSRELKDLPDIDLREDGSGTGSIIFARPYRDWRSFQLRADDAAWSFRGVVDAAEVVRLIRSAQAKGA
jgi:hypothetical protein